MVETLQSQVTDSRQWPRMAGSFRKIRLHCPEAWLANMTSIGLAVSRSSWGGARRRRLLRLPSRANVPCSRARVPACRKTAAAARRGDPSSGRGRRQRPHPLRRVIVRDPRELALLTNHKAFAGATIGDIHRERWQVGLQKSVHDPSADTLSLSKGCTDPRISLAHTASGGSPARHLPHPCRIFDSSAECSSQRGPDCRKTVAPGVTISAYP